MPRPPLIPSPADVRRALAQSVREASVLRRLLRVSEDATIALTEFDHGPLVAESDPQCEGGSDAQ